MLFPRWQIFFLSCPPYVYAHLKQNGNENQGEVEEQTFKEKVLDKKPEEVPPEIVSNERYTECIFFSMKSELK